MEFGIALFSPMWILVYDRSRDSIIFPSMKDIANGDFNGKDM